MSLSLIMLILAIVFFIIEGITSSTVSVWFGIGALVASIFALFIGSIVVIMIIFLLVTIITLLLFRSKLINKLAHTEVRTGYAELVGQNGKVVKKINTTGLEKGHVKVDGEVWTAEATDGLDYEIDDVVEVVEIRGAYLRVKKADK